MRYSVIKKNATLKDRAKWRPSKLVIAKIQNEIQTTYIQSSFAPKHTYERAYL